MIEKIVEWLNKIPLEKRKKLDGVSFVIEPNIVLIKNGGQFIKGEYFRGNNYEDYLDQIYNDLSELKKSEFGVKKVTDYEDRFYYFLIPAILLLIIEIFISEKRSPLYSRINKKLGLE